MEPTHDPATDARLQPKAQASIEIRSMLMPCSLPPTLSCATAGICWPVFTFLTKNVRPRRRAALIIEVTVLSVLTENIPVLVTPSTKRGKKRVWTPVATLTLVSKTGTIVMLMTMTRLISPRKGRKQNLSKSHLKRPINAAVISREGH